MLRKACIAIVLGCLSVANAQTPFCSGDLCFVRPDYSGRTWMESQQRCKENNLTLPVADNSNHQKSIVDALSNFQLYGRDVWLGANASDNGSNNWLWLDGSQYAGTDVQLQGDYSKSYAYIAKRTTEVLAYASPPIDSYSYICQCNVINPGVCTNETGRTAFVKDNRCYMKYEEKLQWFSARNKCLENSCDLASFSQLSLLDGMVDSSGFWVGLRHSQWNWQNAVTGLSADVTFTSWSADQPNDAVPHCMAITSGDFPNWKDFVCTQVYPYICQDIRSSSAPSSSSTPTARFRSTTASTTTKNSPLGSPGTASTGKNGSSSTPLPSSTTSLADLVSKNENNRNSTNAGSVNVALAIGLGVGLGVPFIILIVAVIVVAAVVLRKKHRNSAESRNAQSTNKQRKLGRNGAEFESGEPKIANSKEISSPTSVLPTVESDANDHYQQLQNRYELQEQQQYEQLAQSPQYEQLQNRNELQEQQQYEELPQSQYEQV